MHSCWLQGPRRGIPRVELIGTAFSDCFTEPEKANAIYQLVFEKGMAVDYPLTMRHLDGTLTEVLYNASVYRDGGGKVLGVFAAARDVTKQNAAQAEIAAQRLNELDRLGELERFQRLTVGRELKMIELKKENEYLRKFGPADGGELLAVIEDDPDVQLLIESIFSMDSRFSAANAAETAEEALDSARKTGAGDHRSRSRPGRIADRP
jgi:hypothetical protein